MKVIIDADGCPVVLETVQICRSKHVPCLLVCDTAHDFQIDGIQQIVCDKGSDSTDFIVVNQVAAGDVVITQDYGLASMCLARQARVLHQDGWEYTPWNMDALMLQRYEAHKLRAAGSHIKGNRKRSIRANIEFAAALTGMLQTAVQG